MKKAKIFQNGQSQAVRLPKEFRFQSNEVYVQAYGHGVLIMPLSDRFERLRKSLDSFSEDFMKDRQQPKMQEREEFE